MNNRIASGQRKEPDGSGREPVLGAIIAARMDSRRFPGKVLHPLLGRPLLDHVIQRCRQSPAIGSRIVVATTSRAVDNPVAKHVLGQDLGVYRGGVNDVAKRLIDCAEALGWDGFYRVNADSPCLDTTLFDRAAVAFASGEFDLVTNLHPRSFSYGVSVELLRTETYAAAYGRFHRPEHYEHATLYCYEHSEEFRIHNLLNLDPWDPLPRLAVDTPDDFARVEAHLTRWSNPPEVAAAGFSEGFRRYAAAAAAAAAAGTNAVRQAASASASA